MSAAVSGLPLPNLDDRRWSDLVEEGRALIPLYAPEWTDHNLHDPGITLIELFAWLAEQDLFRIDRISVEQVRKLLALAGATPAPPRPVRLELRVTPAPDRPTARIKPGTEFRGITSGGLSVRFRAVDRTIVTDAMLKAFQVAQKGTYLDRTKYLDRGEPFAPWGDDPGSGAAFLLGFDKPLPAHAWTSLDFTVRDPDESDAERDRLRIEAGALKLEHPAHHSVRLAWEVRTASGLRVPLRATDETRALTFNGRVRLRGSSLWAPMRLGRVEEELFYVCADHGGDVRRAADPARAGRQRGRGRAGPHPEERQGGDQPTPYLRDHPELAGLRFERLAPGDGQPRQVRMVSEPAIAGGSPVIVTKERDPVRQKEDRWVRWSIRPDFDASGRADAHVVLDPQPGTLTFGDGERGRALPDGAVAYVAYRATLAGAGNVPAGTVTAVVDDAPGAGPLNSPGKSIGQILQPRAAWGGRDAETLEQVLARLLDALNETKRAVTAGDCETLARAVPGTAVAVAWATPEQHPDLPCIPAPGIATVTILPRLPAARPAPTPGLRRLVSCYLNRRGVPGSRIVVVGPVYREVVASLTIEVAPQTRAATVQAKAQAALDQFLHPLTGGPDGQGWTIGRDVYRSEVLQALARAGLDGITRLDLSLDGVPPQCGNLCLGPRGLPASGAAPGGDRPRDPSNPKGPQRTMSGPSLPRTPRIERFLHRTYETVRSDDLNGQGAAQDELRAWHNRALHHTYGVVFGLDVNLEGEVPTPGALQARVDPGLAYDAGGRDEFLRATATSPIPFDPRGMTLVLQFGLTAPALAWFPTAGFRINLGVPLAKTVDSTPIEGVPPDVLPPEGFPPPPLVGKVIYDRDLRQLTIRGLLSQAQFDLLTAIVRDQGIRSKIDSIYNAWPFEAPRPSHSIISGLRVTIVPDSSQQTLWAARVTAGRAMNALGPVLELPTDTEKPLDGPADRRNLILRPLGGAAALDLVADPLSVLIKGAVTLGTIGPPADPPVIHLGSPVRTEVADIGTLLEGLQNTKNKIKYDSNAQTITLTGFLTRAEADDLTNLVADNPDSVVKVGQKLDPNVPGNTPVVPLGREDAERVPLFPPRSRPLARPRTASGSSLPGRTEWKEMPDTGSSDPNFKAYEARVAIEAAGFTEVPQLIAWVERLTLHGDPGSEFQPPIPLPLPFLGGIVDGRLIDGKIVDRPDTRRFIFRIWRAVVSDEPSKPVPELGETTLSDWLRDHLYVRWLGVQSDPLPDFDSWPDTGAN